MKDEKFLDVGGRKTRFFEAGRGDPLVLIHGGQYGSSSFCSANDWGLNFDALARSFHVFAFDKLGMGFTDNPSDDNEYTIDATIDHAYNCLEQLGIRQSTVIGHSRGALVAACLALQHADLVKSVVVVDSNTLAPDDPSVPMNFYADIQKSAPESPTVESVMSEARANSYSANHITTEFSEIRYKIATLPKTMEARRKMDATGKSHFYPLLNERRRNTIDSIATGNLRAPTLIVWGLNDPTAPFKLATNLFRIIASKNDRTQLHSFNHAGHYSFREHSDDFNRVISTFLV